MKITLVNFRCHDNLVVEIVEGSITNISANSGVGKSTIFQAILWTLYGKVKNVSNWLTPKVTISVTLEMDDGSIIYRQKNPTIVNYTANGYTSQGEVANHEIIRKYGSMDSFMFTSYVQQDNLHPIIEATSAQKIKMLTSIGLGDQDPEEKIEKINTMIKESEIELGLLIKDYEFTQSGYNKLDLNVNCEWILSESAISNITLEYNNLKLELQHNRSEFNRISVLEGNHNTLTSLIRDSDSKVSILSKYSQSEYDSLKLQSERYKSYNQYLKNKESIESLINSDVTKRDRISSTITSYITNNDNDNTNDNNIKKYTNEDLLSCELNYRRYNDTVRLCSTLNVEYNRESIDSQIRDIELLLKSQDTINLYEKKVSLINKRDTLLRSLPAPIGDKSNEMLQNELVSLQSQCNSKKQEIIDQFKINDNTIQSIFIENLRSINLEKDTQIRDLMLELDSKLKEMDSEYKLQHTNINSNITQINNQILILDNSRTIHKCPKCEASIRYTDNTLELSTLSPFNDSLYRELISKREQLKKDLNVLESNNRTKVSSLKEEHKKKESDITNITNTKVRELESTKSFNLKTSSDMLNGTLKMLETEYLSIVNNTNGIIINNNRVRDISHSIQLVDLELESLKDISAINTRKLTLAEVNTYNRNLVSLRSIVIYDRPDISPDYIKNCIEYDRLSDIISNNRQKLSEIKVIDREDEVKVNLIDYNNKLIEYNSVLRSKNDLELKLSSILGLIDISSITIKSKILEIENRMNEIQISITNSNKALGVMNKYQELMNKRSKVDVTHRKVSKLKEMKVDAQRTLNDLLTEVISRVNSYLRSVCNNIFDDPIDIRLATTKRIKSTKIDKPEVNLLINYKGGSNVSIKELSVGERIRTSTLLSIAFNRCYDSRLLILDEPTAYLDNDKVDELLDLIKTLDITRIIACHHGNTGSYDSVIRLD